MFTSYDIGAIKLPPPADRLTPPTLCRELLSTLLALGLPEPGRRIRLRASRDSAQRPSSAPASRWSKSRHQVPAHSSNARSCRT